MPHTRLQQRARRRVTLMLGNRVPAFTADVSPGGLCVEMASVFMPGSPIHGQMTLGGETFDFKGEVTWAHPGNRQRRELSRFGIRFDHVSEGFWPRYLNRFHAN